VVYAPFYFLWPKAKPNPYTGAQPGFFVGGAHNVEGPRIIF